MVGRWRTPALWAARVTWYGAGHVVLLCFGVWRRSPTGARWMGATVTRVLYTWAPARPQIQSFSP